MFNIFKHSVHGNIHAVHIFCLKPSFPKWHYTLVNIQIEIVFENINMRQTTPGTLPIG